MTPARLETRNLGWVPANGTTPVLREITISVAARSVVGITSGCAFEQAALMHLLGGMMPPSCGQLLIDGDPTSTMPPRRLARKLAFVAMDDWHNDPRCVIDILRDGRALHRLGFHTPNPRDAEVVSGVMDRLNLRRHAFSTLDGLSPAIALRVMLARAMVQEPDLIVLSETPPGLDDFALFPLFDHLRQSGQTVIAGFEDGDLALGLCDRVLDLDRGRLTSAGPRPAHRQG
jgi:iron complex transport system ATP-binding protein